jgi:hypothetical protein
VDDVALEEEEAEYYDEEDPMEESKQSRPPALDIEASQSVMEEELAKIK